MYIDFAAVVVRISGKFISSNRYGEFSFQVLYILNKVYLLGDLKLNNQSYDSS